MRRSKKKRISFLIIFAILFTSIGFALSDIVSYADELNSVNLYSVTSSAGIYNSATSKSPRPKSYKLNSMKIPSSGSFNSESSSNKKNNSTTIKPDSGSFTTSPNSGSSSNSNSSTIKPDSGNFSTTPPKDSNNDGSSNSGGSNNKDYSSDGGYPGGSMSGGGFFGGYFNPFRAFGYGGHISSWIINIVIIITVIVVAYIIIDIIRSKRS